jgi:hypothetical protein
MRSLLLLLLATPLSAQAPLRPRTITEFSIGTRVARSGEEASPFADDNGKMLLAIGLGRVTPVGTRTSVGGIFSAGIQDGNGYLALGPRLRYHASPEITLDVTPSMMLTHSDELAGPLLVDVAVMHTDKIGLSVQAAAGHRKIWTLDGPVKRVSGASLAAGLRLGGKPGRIGGAAAIVTVTALILAVLSSWSD